MEMFGLAAPQSSPGTPPWGEITPANPATCCKFRFQVEQVERSLTSCFSGEESRGKGRASQRPTDGGTAEVTGNSLPGAEPASLPHLPTMKSDSEENKPGRCPLRLARRSTVRVERELAKQPPRVRLPRAQSLRPGLLFAPGSDGTELKRTARNSWLGLLSPASQRLCL